jgi:hypothetical protein
MKFKIHAWESDAQYIIFVAFFSRTWVMLSSNILLTAHNLRRTSFIRDFCNHQID